MVGKRRGTHNEVKDIIDRRIIKTGKRRRRAEERGRVGRPLPFEAGTKKAARVTAGISTVDVRGGPERGVKRK